ncbi:phosphoinositide phospholipase C 1-like isoform X2 [Carica papaya]|uniref:phosphoinositide phospholipase C 1-like isoform X2 n=1 Tax=Carica papaya TaxID=3649 RepID=UPI000B8CA25E|nr:phosphoinositide phospholipase C 1-like isoform X2 [Carica papaya]
MSRATYKICFCMRRIFKVRFRETPEAIEKLFHKYKSENEFMSIDDIHRFLVEVQGERDDAEKKEKAQEIFDKFRHHVFHRKGLNLDAFSSYLLSDDNSPLLPPQVHHPMDKPLAHYFMYTGHNSYLTGNQFCSRSSTEPIIKALRSGVRVIELDLWPNAAGDKAEVRHGGTLTSPVALQKCLNAIKDHAFEISKYPVVITFEDHLTRDLQASVAKLVAKTFRDMLFCPGTDNMKEFPSPESLTGKTMISTKPPKEYLETQDTKEKRVTQRMKYTTDEEFPGDLKAQDLAIEEAHMPDEDEDAAAPEYRHLIAIHAGKLKGGLQNWLKDNPNKVRRLSLSEQELESAKTIHGSEIVRFTQRNFLRIYPKGTRLDSSNYNPFIGWIHGAQMVAFNMQGYGKYLWMMQGMFKANGGCGYVKKPDFLVSVGPNNEVFDPTKTLPVKKLLKVRIILGKGWDVDFSWTHFDRFSPPDFFVGIAGVSTDAVMKYTKVIQDEWLPVWDEEFEFPLTVPELALLRIEVIEFDTSRKHDFGGQTCLPISELRTGVRAVRLCNRKGEEYSSVRLLVHFGFVIFS